MRGLIVSAALLCLARVGQAQSPTSCAGRPSTDTSVYGPSAVSEPPTLRSFMTVGSENQPPDSGQRTRISLIVNADGRVDPSSARVLDRTNPTFEQDALMAVRQRTYWPACREGMAVRARLIVALDYAAVYGRP